MTQAWQEARCLCQGIQFKVQINSHDVTVCHCSICRKMNSGPIFSVTAKPELEVISGLELIKYYHSSTWMKRAFCKKYGSYLFSQLTAKEHDIFLNPELLYTDQEEMVLTTQIFYDEKPKFYAFSNKTNNLTAEEVLNS